MYAEYCAIDKRCDIEVIEYIHTISPGIRIPILFDAFVIKTVDLRYLAALMVSTDQSNTVRVSHLLESTNHDQIVLEKMFG